jgi:hypothetical protein
MKEVVAKRLFNIKRKKEMEKLISVLKDEVQDDEIFINKCKEYGFDPTIISDINISFDDDLDVSAKTINGDVFLNGKLFDEGDEDVIKRYFFHETVHYFQQHCNLVTEKTKKEDYLDDPNEIEAFNTQIEFMEETDSPKEVKKYIDDLLDHHHITNRKERQEKIKKLTEND